MPDDSPELKDAIDKVRNRRRDGMLVAAYLGLGGIIYVIVYEQASLTEYGQGVITMIAGALVGFLTMIHNFEFGATRSSAAKDNAITDLTKTAAANASAAQTLAVTASVPNGKVAVTPAPPLPDGTVPAATADKISQPKDVL